MGATAGSSVRTARALERLAALERRATCDTRDADAVRAGLGQIRRAARRYRTQLRKLQEQHAECYGEAGANVDEWIDWMARGPATGGLTNPETPTGEA